MNRPSLTIGIEEEYQTVDPVTFDLRSHIQTEIMSEGQRQLKEKVKAEMHQAVVEVGMGVCRTVKLGYAGVGPHATRVREAEATLASQPATDANFAKAADSAAEHVRPTGDVHADEAYRRDLVRALTRRVLAAALARYA